MSPIRVGVIGLSAIPKAWASTALVPPLLEKPLSEKFKLTALCTSSEQSAAAAAKKYSELAGHQVKGYHGASGYTGIATDPNVDFVIVSLNVPSHKDAILPAIEAGKNFYLEWPAGVDLEETKQIAEAAKRKGVKSVVGAQIYRSPAFNKIKEIIESGQLGRIISTTVIGSLMGEFPSYSNNVTEEYEYMTDPSKGATKLTIACGHFMAGFLYVFGNTTFSSVVSTSTIAFPTISIIGADGKKVKELPAREPDQIAFSGLLKGSNALASLNFRFGLMSTPGRNNLTWFIDGDKGSIRVEGQHVFLNIVEPKVYLNGELLEIKGHEVPEVQPEMAVERGQGYAGIDISNVRSLWKEVQAGRDENYMTIEKALDLKKLMDAVTRSAKEGNRVEL